MEVIRCARALVPLAAIALLSAPGVARAPAPGAADPPWDPPACRGSLVAAQPAGTGAAWYRMDAVLDWTGTLAAQRLTVGIVGQAARTTPLPAESFATGPVHGLVLVGDDDGIRSRLQIVDPARACSWTLATEAAVIRSAILSPDGSAVIEHRVDRATREDAGVWRRATGGGTTVRVLPGLASDLMHGRTFATDLRWAPDGRVVVGTCGELVCRTRIVDPATGLAASTDGTGPVIGMTEARVLAYDVCPGFPCSVVAADGSAAVETVVTDAGPAALADGSLVFEHAGHVAQLDLRTHRLWDVAGSDGYAPNRDGSRAGAGMDLPPNDVLLVATGQRPDPSTARRFNPATSSVEPVSEVQR